MMNSKLSNQITTAGLRFTLLSSLVFLCSCHSFSPVQTVNGLATSVHEEMQSGPHKQNVFQLRPVWSFQGTEKTNEGFRKVNRATPLLAKVRTRPAVIFANGLDGLVAYDQKTSTVLWRIRVPFGVEATPVVWENNLYVPGLDGKFYAFDLDTGDELWVFNSRSEHLSEPLVTEKHVFFLSGANSLFALERITGNQAWSYVRQETGNASIRAGSRPVLYKGFLLAGFSDGAIVSLAELTGNLKWEQNLNKGARFRDIDSDLVLDGDLVYALGFDDQVYCLKASTGELAWKSQPGGWGRPAIKNDQLVFATTNSEVVSLDKTSGKKMWTFKLAGGGVATSPVILQLNSPAQTLVFGESQGSLRFLDLKTGQSLGEFDPGRGVLSSPLVDESQNSVYFISGQANVYSVEYTMQPRSHFPHLSNAWIEQPRSKTASDIKKAEASNSVSK